MMKTALIIPAFNAEKTIAPLIKKNLNYMSEKDIVVVDDGSSDNTADIVSRFPVNLIRHEYNRGKGAALSSGIDFAIENNYDYVITMDADFQHDPDAIPQFLALININKFDLIIGTRKFRVGEMPLHRYISNQLTSLVVSITVKNRIHDSQSGFRAIRTDVLRNMKLISSGYQTESEILIRAGKKDVHFGELPIKTIYQGDEVSHINPGLDTLRFIILIVKSWWW
jgi:glycosyltransferase involved in cell wall biosynthesis